jgi:2',3'-cyclic-nucleotide 2'-phosphodiesterase (5'-nucleotidase family)
MCGHHVGRPFVLHASRHGLMAIALLWLEVGFLKAGEVAITLLHTNDIHQELERLPQIAAYVADYRRQHPETLFLDAGDFFDRGSALVALTRGEAVFTAMSLMGYDLRIVGNHDWSYGAARLRELIAGQPGIFLGTNLAALRPPLPRNVRRTVIREFQGIRLGFFGITVDTYAKNAKLRPELYVLDAQAEAARAVAELKPQVDLIVAVTHVGFNRMAHEAHRPCPSDVDLARTMPGIQIIVGGHSHTLVAEQETRRLYEQTGSLVVQAGASGKWLGRLTLWVDQDTRRMRRFQIEHVDTSTLQRANPEVARYLQAQYERYLPHAKTVLGQFAEPMEFYNLAYWYADFLRQQAGADIALVARKALYDEPKSFARGPVTVERLFGYVHERYLVRAEVQGSELLKYCRSEGVRDRFNPFHHQGRPFTGDAIYCSGMSARYRPDERSVEFSIDPQRTYTLVVPWPFDKASAHLCRDRMPERQQAQAGPLVPGLTVKNAVVLPSLARELLVSVGRKEGLKFTRRYPQPDPQWRPWTSHFEEQFRAVPSPPAVR